METSLLSCDKEINAKANYTVLASNNKSVNENVCVSDIIKG